MTPDEVKAHLWKHCTRCEKCLLWDRACDDAGVPIVRMPGAKRVSQARRVLMEAMGIDLAGKIATTRCNNPRCMDEKHVVAWTRKQLQKRSGKKFIGNVVRGAKLAMKRRQTAKLTMDKVREMRVSGRPYEELAAETGVSLSTVAQAMRGESWKEYGSAFGGPGAMGARS